MITVERLPNDRESLGIEVGLELLHDYMRDWTAGRVDLREGYWFDVTETAPDEWRVALWDGEGVIHWEVGITITEALARMQVAFWSAGREERRRINDQRITTAIVRLQLYGTQAQRDRFMAMLNAGAHDGFFGSQTLNSAIDDVLGEVRLPNGSDARC